MVNPEKPIEPLKTPGTTPVSPTPQYGEGKPAAGAAEAGQEPKPFSLPPEPGKSVAGTTGTEAAQQASPMAAAQEAGKVTQWTPEEMTANAQKMQQTFSSAQGQLQDPSKTQNLSQDHYNALNKLTSTLDPEMKTMASNTGQTYAPPAQAASDSPLGAVTKWIDGAQGTMSGVLNFLSSNKQLSMPQMMQVQYAMQKAAQRGELFASIIGSSVSGVKSIMSIQLG